VRVVGAEAMIFLLMFVLAVLVGVLSLPGPVRLHDDQAAIVARRDMYSREDWQWVLKAQRPVFELVNRWNFRWCGYWPFGWHGVNLLIHGLATVSLYGLLTRFHLQNPEWLTVAFAVHPIQTSSLGYVSGRSGMLAGLFLFLFAAVYLCPFPWNCGSPLFLIVAIGAREDSVIGLLWLPVLEWFR
jgi:hypothetical protein